MTSKHYKYFQPNDKDKKDDQSDCVIRALCKVMNKTWLEVFDELLPIARDIQCNPNSKPCYKRYLEEHGFEYVGISNKKGSKRPTVESFSKDHKEGTYFFKRSKSRSCVSWWIFLRQMGFWRLLLIRILEEIK